MLIRNWKSYGVILMIIAILMNQILLPRISETSGFGKQEMKNTQRTSPLLPVSNGPNNTRYSKGTNISLWDIVKNRRCRKTSLSELAYERSEVQGEILSLGKGSCSSNIIQPGTMENLRDMNGDYGLSSDRDRDGMILENLVDPELEKHFRYIDDYTDKDEGHSFSGDCRDDESEFGKILMKETQKISAPLPVSSDRERVNNTLGMFRDICNELQHKGTKGPIDLTAWRIMKETLEFREFREVDRRIGPVLGVDVGDEFNYRIEAYLVGVHKKMVGGIDFMRDGTTEVCISVVALDGGDYTNDVKRADFITYSGQGCNIGATRKEFKDQTLNNKGNCALKTSFEVGNPVRVIRGNKKQGCRFYVYDGLYTIVKFWKEKAAHGRMEFKFGLQRNPGQAPLSKRQWRKLSAH